MLFPSLLSVRFHFSRLLHKLFPVVANPPDIRGHNQPIIGSDPVSRQPRYEGRIRLQGFAEHRSAGKGHLALRTLRATPGAGVEKSVYVLRVRFSVSMRRCCTRGRDFGDLTCVKSGGVRD